MYCPYLQCNVELSDNRRKHIELEHSELLPRHPELIEQVLAKPEVIRKSAKHPNGFLFSRWFPHFLRGKHVVVIVIKEMDRCWIMTAFPARRLSGGFLLWTHRI